MASSSAVSPEQRAKVIDLANGMDGFDNGEWALPQFQSWVGLQFSTAARSSAQAALMMRIRRRRVDARPYPCRFRTLTLVTVPSTGPVDHGSLSSVDDRGV